MNVTFVALGVYGGEGGIERFNRRLLGSLAASGHRAGAIVLWDAEDEAAAAPDGVAVVACRRSKPRAVAAFARALLRERPDVVLYGHVLLAPLALLAKVLRPRAANVLVVHGYEVWSRPSAVARRVVRAAVDRVASVSDYTARKMASAYGIDGSRFVRLVNAVDTGPSRPPRGTRSGDKLLVVSRLDPVNKAKNVDKVIAAMPRVLEDAPRAHLYVAGDGAWRPELEALARSLGVAEHVHLVGAVSDEQREALYAGSDVFVLPSTQEGFGIVYLEAWRHALPVVAGAGGAAPEVVRDGVEGLVVEPSPEAIATAVLRLLRDPALRDALGEAGYRRLTSYYTGRHFDEMLSKVLDEVVAA
ncbi:MAG: glycosyltransferase family 4 protein [Actinomycetota bacterium]|nr:glycosyltransferase family 4 protein [Actinomycetota bacterium]